MHDKSKILMGVNRSTFKIVDNMPGVVKAGLIARSNAGTLSATAGVPKGVSFGEFLADKTRTNICRAGLEVPVILTSGFTPVQGAQVHYDPATGMAVAAGENMVGLNAVYSDRKGDPVVLAGIKEDGSTPDERVALIDFVGGL